MRITGGQAKGRTLATPKGDSIRPTSDQVKEAIFNIIGHDLTGFLVLDLFAGTGNLGLEALSRGALTAVFVDKSRQSINLIRKNLSICGFEKAGIILRRDLNKGIANISLPGNNTFDLVFLDPPYEKGFLHKILKDLAQSKVLAPFARVLAESRKNVELPDSIERIKIEKKRTYGDTSISLYIKNED
jgi:16S rRNA (guanine966-N2)-methyltransferase